MSVEENLELGGWMFKRDRARLRQAFEEVYARFPRLKERAASTPARCPGGEQRMLEIARLTMTGPKTLLLDEPSVGLMPKLVEFVYEEIAKLKQEEFTILVVDQNVKKSIEIADYVYVLNLGEDSHHGPQRVRPAARGHHSRVAVMDQPARRPGDPVGADLPGSGARCDVRAHGHRPVADLRHSRRGHFAHGEFFMLGTYVMYFVAAALGLPFVAGVAAAAIVLFVVGVLVERALLEPLRQRAGRAGCSIRSCSRSASW